MFFRRKKKQSTVRKSLPPEQRDLYRLRFGETESLVASLTTGDGRVTDAQVSDLTLHGAGLQIPFEYDPHISVGEVVELSLHSSTDGWTIATPVMTRQYRQEGDRHLHYGLQFLNLGNLYAQMEDALGRYFNRRKRPRVTPELDSQPIAHLAFKHFRLRAPIHDLSVGGVCASLGHVEASPLTVGDLLELRFQLPAVKKPFEGRVMLRRRTRLSAREFLGLEFDLDRPSGLTKRQDELREYVERRLSETEAFSRSLAGGDEEQYDVDDVQGLAPADDGIDDERAIGGVPGPPPKTHAEEDAAENA